MSFNVRDPNIQIKERNSEFDLLSHYSSILRFDNYIDVYVRMRAHVRVLDVENDTVFIDPYIKNIISSFCTNNEEETKEEN